MILATRVDARALPGVVSGHINKRARTQRVFSPLMFDWRCVVYTNQRVCCYQKTAKKAIIL